MLDPKALAAARGWNIPAEDLEKITPSWHALEKDLIRVLAKLPDGPDSAAQFHVRGEAE